MNKNIKTTEHLKDALIAVREVSDAALNNLSLNWCYKCKQVKPITEFYNHKGRADGKDSLCKNCALERVRKIRSVDPDYFNNKAKESYYRRKNKIMFVIRRVLKKILRWIRKYF